MLQPRALFLLKGEDMKTLMEEIKEMLIDAIYSDEDIAKMLDCDILDVEYVKRMMEDD